jgi:hypothetical protein
MQRVKSGIELALDTWQRRANRSLGEEEKASLSRKIWSVIEVSSSKSSDLRHQPKRFTYAQTEQTQQQQQVHAYTRERTAFSVKASNACVNRWSATRNAVGGAKEINSITISIITAMTAKITHTADVIAPTLSLAAALLALHFIRRLEVKYEDACTLDAAWRCAEWADGEYIFTIEDLYRKFDELKASYSISEMGFFQIDKSILFLESIHAISKSRRTGYFKLAERVTMHGDSDAMFQ